MSSVRRPAPPATVARATPAGLLRPFGRLRWPWRITTTTLTQRPPLIAWNTYPRQVIGIHFRLPDGPRLAGGDATHHGLSILWARPDIRAYPKNYDA